MLERIKGPQDLKMLNVEEMQVLADDLRGGLMNRLSKKGGHFGPNFGMVEATIALHYVFDSPKDKFVFDVSHQTYCHKMLTGRSLAYTDETHFHDVSGYTNPKESEHDFFNIGHTSTSVSLACGLAKGRDLVGGNENIVAIIGDGSLSGGEALEGLDFAAELGTNLIVVVNDNDMSIAENHGGLYTNLRELRESNGTCENNLFRVMGLDYMYLHEGNNIEKLIEIFQKAKDVDHPLVVHINTMKGMGYEPAMEQKENWHWCMPFDVETGKSKHESSGENYGTLTCEYLMKKMKEDQKVVTLVAGVPTNIGFTEDKRREAGKQFVDVGIAEEHAVAMASGIAKNGGKPVFATHSSFFQRTYDQVVQDLCMNGNSATLLINTASVFGMNDESHLGIFDIPLFSNIPNLVYLAPTNCEEYFAMLDWSIEQNEYPVAVRIPCNGVFHSETEVAKDYRDINKYQVTTEGCEVAIFALGDFYQLGEMVAEAIEAKTGKTPTLINPRYITGLDVELLENLKKNHSKIVTLEDGVLEGGFGQKIASYYGPTELRVYNYGLTKKFHDRYKALELMKENRLDPELILEDLFG